LQVHASKFQNGCLYILEIEVDILINIYDILSTIVWCYGNILQICYLLRMQVKIYQNMDRVSILHYATLFSFCLLTDL
jgi:hypothetical protein